MRPVLAAKMRASLHRSRPRTDHLSGFGTNGAEARFYRPNRTFPPPFDNNSIFGDKGPDQKIDPGRYSGCTLAEISVPRMLDQLRETDWSHPLSGKEIPRNGTSFSLVNASNSATMT